MSISRYNNTENLKITYLFGAGASYNSVPIWNMQGETMILIGEKVEYLVRNTDFKLSEIYKNLYNSQVIINLGKKLIEYGYKAIEFGTLDIYARSLFLLNNNEELNNLKYHLSVYFDLWENFLFKDFVIDKNKKTKYSQIDKRYFSLLSVLLDKGNPNPQLNPNVSFISWNYDLQLETAYKSFIHDSEKHNLEHVNRFFKFYDRENKNDILHLNGFRGYFNYDNTLYPNVVVKPNKTIEDYLLGILDNKKQFKNQIKVDYTNNIKYAWEGNNESLASAINVLEKTNLLIVVGYSFPSYNRETDSKMIASLGSKSVNKEIKQVIYQNPNINRELLENICGSNIEVKHIENTSQFHIPHEFLFPQKGDDIFFG
tara:strand:+ start:206 stop:1318 length:1113 start_codon:yes stop_codon:yes gene_type:complete